ncbi:adenylosuccinate lyase [Dinghuibacter silviterrae]|uniref:Adenylosuccinate lyase n=1 Tax=Dinghuibacter silviterrae TaxID=1539049 RepID=A0A4R8DHC4_9BACT|nr:adenylosuccinate lyase [Dinghuibacter silviterrae]TDW96634.1 adenylosuccinate lyase [Dinghuibacter silviterrae]
MDLQSLTAISPIDGRYRRQVERLDGYFSEFGLIRYRVRIEVEYLFHLSEAGFVALSEPARAALTGLMDGFTTAQAAKIKDIEKITNHDIKAVEYFIKSVLDEAGAGAIKEWVHFGLTSQDINNTAIPLSWKDGLTQEWQPAISGLIANLAGLAQAWKDIPMLARTHGQPASPTRLGKEFMVFVERLRGQAELFGQMPFGAKFGGATGNFNAHHIAYPATDWIAFGNSFVNERLGLARQQFTTQIEHYDGLAAQFDALKRINTTLIDLCRDIWTYISMDYFKQKIKEGEIGSSAMPHKVNPIDFENAEGNLGLANALFEHLSAKLPVSRLQRDLTDSTVLRNLGVPLAHSLLSIRSIERGLEKLILNPDVLHQDLEDNWAVVAEAVQTVLRREQYPNPYEALKALTRGASGINRESMHAFIDGLDVDAKLKAELKKITPQNYTGVVADF